MSASQAETADPTQVSNALTRAAELIGVAEEAVSANQPFDLNEFNGILDHACIDAVKLPQPAFKEVRAQLRGLLARLEVLRREVHARATAA